MRTVVFGASGFIGRAVVAALVARGHRVLGVVRSDRSAEIVRRHGATPLHGDLTAPATWRAAVSGADAVVQLAAAFDADPAAAERPWLEAMLALAADAAAPPRLVYTGGCWLFPARTAPPIGEETPFDPLPAFAYMVENAALLRRAGLPVVTVHPGIVWSESGGVLGELVSAARAGETVEIVGGTDVCWPLVHVEDIARLYVLALERGEPGSDHLGVADPGVPVGDLVRRAEGIAGRRLATRTVAVDQAVSAHGAWIAGKARSQRIEARAARDRLGWRPQRRFEAG